MAKAKAKTVDAARLPSQLQLGDVPNWETLQRAITDGRAGLMRTKERASGEYRTLICAINGDLSMSPLAVLIWGNPFEQFESPTDLEVPHGG